MVSMVFVHGTGVYRERYESVIAQMEQTIAMLELDLSIVPCFWASLLSQHRRQGERVLPAARSALPSLPLLPHESQATRQLWAILLDDPFFEIRLLASYPVTTQSTRRRAGLWLDQQLRGLRFADLLKRSTEQLKLAAALERARGQLIAHPAYHQMLTVNPECAEVRAAICRALIALVLRGSTTISASTSTFTLSEQGRLLADGRVTLVALINQALSNTGGVLARLFAPRELPLAMNVEAVLRELASEYLERHRSSQLGQRLHAFVGDIMWYAVHGQRLRAFIRDCVLRAPPPVLLLAHSFGAVPVLDLLIAEELPIALLVTAGTQVPFLYAVDALPLLRAGQPLPAHFPDIWVNLYNRRDLLSYLAEPVFPGRAEDVEIHANAPLPLAHQVYWRDPEGWMAIELASRRAGITLGRRAQSG